MMVSEKINERIEVLTNKIYYLKCMPFPIKPDKIMRDSYEKEVIFLQDLLKDVEEMEFELGDLRSIEY